MEPAAQLARMHFKVQGRVQGVYFRASAVQRAQELGLTGWVKNCADGSVEGVAEGPRPALEKLMAWCRQGPSGARVTDVETRWDDAQNTFSAFTVER
jgi:acylphosphatase